MSNSSPPVVSGHPRGGWRWLQPGLGLESSLVPRCKASCEGRCLPHFKKAPSRRNEPRKLAECCFPSTPSGRQGAQSMSSKAELIAALAPSRPECGGGVHKTPCSAAEHSRFQQCCRATHTGDVQESPRTATPSKRFRPPKRLFFSPSQVISP